MEINRENFFDVLHGAVTIVTASESDDFKRGVMQGVVTTLGVVDAGGVTLVDNDERVINPGDHSLENGLRQSWNDYVAAINT